MESPEDRCRRSGQNSHVVNPLPAGLRVALVLREEPSAVDSGHPVTGVCSVVSGPSTHRRRRTRRPKGSAVGGARRASLSLSLSLSLSSPANSYMHVHTRGTTQPSHQKSEALGLASQYRLRSCERAHLYVPTYTPYNSIRYSIFNAPTKPSQATSQTNLYSSDDECTRDPRHPCARNLQPNIFPLFPHLVCL